MIPNQHQITGSEPRVQSSSRISQYQVLDPEDSQDPHWKGQRGRVVTFVVVNPPLETDDRTALELSQTECSHMTSYSGSREMRILT